MNDTMDDMSKSYTGTLGGTLNLVDPQVLHRQTSVPAGPDHQRGSAPAGNQPNENIGAGDGSMVVHSPSASSTGEMHPGAGARSVESE